MRDIRGTVLPKDQIDWDMIWKLYKIKQTSSLDFAGILDYILHKGEKRIYKGHFDLYKRTWNFALSLQNIVRNTLHNLFLKVFVFETIPQNIIIIKDLFERVDPIGDDFNDFSGVMMLDHVK